MKNTWRWFLRNSPVIVLAGQLALELGRRLTGRSDEIDEAL